MKLKNILFYSFFIITSTLATIDSTQNRLSQGISFELKNKKASFYEYDVVDYLCTYKFRSYIFFRWEYLVAAQLMDKFNHIKFIYFVFSLLLLAVFTILRALCYRYGVNSFRNRFLFWFRQLGMRAIIPLFSIFIISLIDDKDDKDLLLKVVFHVHLIGYILIWIFPEKAKLILYGPSNKISSAKGTSK